MIRPEDASLTDAQGDEALVVPQIGGLRLSESLWMALANLSANKLRTALTALGVIIGVAVVVALLALGRGTQQQVTELLTANGTNLLTINSGTAGAGGIVSSAKTLTLEDVKALSNPQTVSAITEISPEQLNSATVVAGRTNAQTFLIGATPGYLTIHNNSLTAGAFLADDHVHHATNVAVLGARVATTLFGEQNPVGQSIRIQGQRFRVIGVLGLKGGTMFGSVDDNVVVPLSTLQRKLVSGRVIGNGRSSVSSIVMQVRDKDSIDEARTQLETALRRRHRLPSDGTADDFNITNQQDMINVLTQTTQTLTLYLGSIAAISLVVGGIGIMNIMLVSVHERTSEIGLRKALGARERDIMSQFLIEALTLSTCGGVVGVILGVLVAVGATLSGLSRASVSIESVALALTFAMATGIFFGIEPARRAAQLDPIEALRRE